MTWDRVGQLPEIISDGTTGYVHLPGQTISHDTATSIGLEDALGSVRYQTDPTGTTTHTLSYTPYGQLASGTPLTPFGYTGEWIDPTGHVHLRACVYQPTTGRFLTADPIQPNHPGTQGWNHYTYTTNNPTTLTGQTGEISLLTRSIVSGIGVGGAAGLARASLCDPGDVQCRIHSIAAGTTIGLLSGGISAVISGSFFFAACGLGGSAAALENAAARNALGLEAPSGRDALFDFMLGCVSAGVPFT